MSHPAPQSAQDRDAKTGRSADDRSTKRQCADAPLDSASSAAPIGSVASTDSSDSAAVELQTQPQPHSLSLQSIAQRCHTDALHCIFAFLSLGELLPALHSCRSWLGAGSKEPSRSLQLDIWPWSIAALIASPLRHHIANVNSNVSLSLGELRQLRSLPRLTALSVRIKADEMDAFLQSAGDGAHARQQRAQLLSAAFPTTQLHSIGLGFDKLASLCTRQALVDALPTAPSLRTVKLAISIADVDLSPLLQLPQLSDLHMSDSPSPVQCTVIKQSAALTRLVTDCHNSWEDGSLEELLQPPHALQRLEEAPLSFATVDPPLLAALLHLPALTQLEPGLIEPECWAGLSDFIQLRQLTVCWDDEFTAAHRSALQSSLNALPHLSDLTLGLPLDSQSDGPSLALRLPALRSLYLHSVRPLSLEFLQHSPLIEQLRCEDCVEMSADDVMHWLRTAAPPLRILNLDRSVRLSVDQESLLHPPSALLPVLAEFSCEHPRAHYY